MTSGRRRRSRRIVRRLVLVASAAVMVPMVAGTVAVATYVFVPLPATLPKVERPQADSQQSTVYAADGSVIGAFKEAQTRVVIPADKIPGTIRRAVVAAEDDRFFQHHGVDLQGIARAFWNDVRSGRAEQGGSTITQQLVKNLYTGPNRTLTRKTREAFIAVNVERVLSKHQILAQYLNTVYLGDSAFGVEAASQSYFHKPAKDLTLSEAALLAGVLPAPSRYSPRTHPDEAEARRQFVLDRLLRTGLASREEVAAARADRPVVQPPPQVVGRYPFFLDYLRVYLLDVRHYSPDLLYRGGLRIETTLDPALEEQAQSEVSKTLNRPNDPEAALVAVEPQTGYVRALVGGRDWDASKVNLALGRLGGGSGRQAGSAFKPFVLTRALEAGVSPSRRYPAPATVQPPGFTRPVSNYEGGAYGSADLRTATWKSINTVFVQLIVDVGIKETAALAKRLGITSIDLGKPIYGGIAIGTQEVSPLDMASAFSVFAARGLRAEPVPVLRITGRGNEVVEDDTQPPSKRILEEVVADNVTAILKGVIEKGTGTRADIGRPAAGKTGTSENWENAWFVGYTPTLSTAVWMGYPKANVSMVGVHGVARVVGGSLPAQMWHDFMLGAVKDVPPTDFTEPAPIQSLAERSRRDERGGFELGERRDPSDLPSEPLSLPPRRLPVPVAIAPVATTTTTAPAGPGTTGTTVTTSSTAPPASSTTTTRRGIRPFLG